MGYVPCSSPSSIVVCAKIFILHCLVLPNCLLFVQVVAVDEENTWGVWQMSNVLNARGGVNPLGDPLGWHKVECPSVDWVPSESLSKCMQCLSNPKSKSMTLTASSPKSWCESSSSPSSEFQSWRFMRSLTCEGCIWDLLPYHSWIPMYKPSLIFWIT